MEKINQNMIAPCGMNCEVCSGHLREKNKCPGCNNGPTLGYCQKCRLKHCKNRKGDFCFECEEFPCVRLKQLDKRYRAKYEMSEIENLEFIRDKGLEKFVENEEKRWITKDGIYCVHNKKRYKF